MVIARYFRMSCEEQMRVLGVVLISVGLIWAVMCFVGIAMMSRSVDMFTEAFLPSLPGIVAAGAGIRLLRRSRSVA